MQSPFMHSRLELLQRLEEFYGLYVVKEYYPFCAQFQIPIYMDAYAVE